MATWGRREKSWLSHHLHILLWQSIPKDMYSTMAMDPVFLRASIPFEKQFHREKYVSCLNTTCLDTLRLQSALQQQKYNCSVSHFCWLPLVSWHRLESTRCLTSITDVQSKMQKKGRLDLLTSTEQALYYKVMFTLEHSMPGGNLLLEILCSNIL